MNKRKSDPFLAQTSLMLAILLVMYALGGNAGAIDLSNLAEISR